MEKYGRLVVIAEAGKGPRGLRLVRCQCDCGNMITTEFNRIKNGNTRSCGCLYREVIKNTNITHGKSYTRLYNSWRGMKDRCLNPKHTGYKNYGGRGIKLFHKWLVFENFMIWALSHGYWDGLTIERTDTNGDYSPDNCTWATRKKQGNNKRNNHLITFEGVTKTAAEWSELTGIHVQTLLSRVRLGWPIGKALNAKVGSVKTGPKPKAATGIPVYVARR